MVIQIFFLIILIITNAFFSGSEMALISLNDNRIKKMAEDGNKKAIMLKKLLGHPSKFLSTIQIGITLAGFLASAFAANSFSIHLVNFIRTTNIPVSEDILNAAALIFITIILSYFTLVLGELVPKRIAMKKAEKISMIVVRPLTIISIIAAPFVKILTLSTNFFVRLIGIDPKKEEEKVTEEEIRFLVDIGGEKGTIQKSEKEMINNVFEFDNINVSDIMTPRVNISALPISATIEEIISFFNTKMFSRIPIYKNAIDHIVGIIHSKDIIRHIANKQRDFILSEVMREPLYVLATKKASNVFNEMQKSNNHIVVVIDEYGGTAGIVTLEDLLEEIVGNIYDEYDEVEKELEIIDDKIMIIDGKMSLDKVSNYLNISLPIDEYETLSGFIIGHIGMIPETLDSLCFEYKGYIFKALKLHRKRITKVQILKQDIINN